MIEQDHPLAVLSHGFVNLTPSRAHFVELCKKMDEIKQPYQIVNDPKVLAKELARIEGASKDSPNG